MTQPVNHQRRKYPVRSGQLHQRNETLGPLADGECLRQELGVLCTADFRNGVKMRNARRE